RIAPSIGVDQSFQGLDQLGVMMDQRLSSGPRMPDSLNGEGALRKALDGPIDGRARKTSNTGDDGNTSSSQSLAIEGCNQVLLSLIEVRKQQGVLPLKFFGFAHSRIIPSPPSFVTLNFLRALTNPEPVLLRTRELLIYQQKDFWTANWSLTGKDNSAGRRSVVDALVQIGRNKRAGREWSEDVELLESEPE